MHDARSNGTPTPPSLRVRTLFGRVIELPREEWSAYLDRECPETTTRSEVERLLRHHNPPNGDFLEAPAATPHVTEVDSWANSLVGSRIGQYTLVRLIASGGMGCVFEARQDNPSRAVAVKVLAPGISAPSALARFRLEPEMLARLQHPNIAQVFESGVHDGELGPIPFFAMELIREAQTIVEFAVAASLDTRKRLALFAKVCDAVHHGHQKSVIHRDLKPANILVGADGEPKVIDFGVARATDADVLLTTQQTSVGDLIGTVRYMSPEQCDGDSTRIDIRSDVYSLGVVLFELLTGQSPYEKPGTTIYAAVRMIKEDAPRRPGDQIRNLRGDVDAIVLKALEKDPARRYGSAADLGRDIRRHLVREPIEARPPTRWIRLVQWVGRRPILATAAICASLVSIAAIMSLLIPWYALQLPDRLVYETLSYEMRLVTPADRTLARWSATRAPWSDGRLIPAPDSLGGGRLAVVPFAQNVIAEDDAVLKVFNVDRDLSRPVWTSRLKRSDLNDYCLCRSYQPRSFTPMVSGVADIFEQVPGDEIVVCYTHSPNSQVLIRIYDLTGRVLFQVWHDGVPFSTYWLRASKRLIVAATNGVVPWERRDTPGLPAISKLGAGHAVVLFSIQPKLGELSNDWLATYPDAEHPAPDWYSCIWPPNVAEGSVELMPPFLADPADAVRVRVVKDADEQVYISFEVDAKGRIIGGSVRHSDPINRGTYSVPGLDQLELRGLPKIRGFDEQPRVTPIDPEGQVLP